jgi:hypothetical protein
VFAWRQDHDPHVASLDDQRLGGLRIGVQMIGDDFSNTPPAHALARRGYVQNVRGYMVYGDYDDAAPAAPIMRALAAGDIDIAVVWGPIAGYFASRVGMLLSIGPIEPQLDPPGLPMTFEISMGVRRDDPNLRAELNRALIARRRDRSDPFRVRRTPALRAKTGNEFSERFDNNGRRLVLCSGVFAHAKIARRRSSKFHRFNCCGTARPCNAFYLLLLNAP